MFKDKQVTIGLAIAIILFLSFIVPFAKQDMHLTRLYEMDRCFKDGQIPCRWISEGEFFYGSPIFNYFAPLPYYFGELINFVTKSLTISVKIIFAVGLVGSFIFMYLFASNFLQKSRAYMLAIFYTFLSFSVMIFYNEGVGVTWGLTFFPLIFLSFNLLSQKNRNDFFLLRSSKFVLFSSISLSLLILSADSAPIFLGLIFLMLIYQYIRVYSFIFLLLTLSAVLFAISLSSFYLLPAVLERNLVHSVFVGDPMHFLPTASVEKTKMVPDSKYQILTGDSRVSNFKQGTNWLRFEINTKTHTIIRLSQFYFPNWKIFIDGRETQVEYKNNSLGLMTIILGEGNHVVEGRLFDTPIRTIANIITIVAVIFILLLGIVQFKSVRNSLNYYRKRIS